MATAFNLEPWIQEQYDQVGVLTAFNREPWIREQYDQVGVLTAFSLEPWVREQYDLVGVLDGRFIGKKAFKKKLFPHFPSRTGEIRLLVNK